MTSKQILEKYINFFKDKGHKQIPNVSLIPENDPTLLYVNSGMFPLVPYLSGEPHPMGKRLVNVQRALRFFEDLENIGETNRHTTAFHMMGNWSLGDYFKKEQLNWIYEYMVEILGLDINRIYASVFEGDKDAPKDKESIKILKEIFSKYGIGAKENERIFAYDKIENWWQRGEAIGELGGPDSEIFYYIGTDGTGLGKNPAQNQDEFLEIGNSVFMQYKKTQTGWEELPQKNVDFGGGLERIALAMQNKKDIYQTDNFWPIIEKLQEISKKNYAQDQKTTKSMRIIADHMRAATFLAMDGVISSNKDQGYILRRLLRRMVRAGKSLEIEKDVSVNLVVVVCDNFTWLYPELKDKKKKIEKIFAKEEEKFRKTLNKGARHAERNIERRREAIQNNPIVLASLASGLHQSLGYPAEIFLEDVKDKGIDLTPTYIEAFEEELKRREKEHQTKSRKGAEQKFKGGLANKSGQTIKYHTATHLLHWALRQVLGNHVTQQGSNITGKRLRFDFSHHSKLSEQEKEKVQNLVNQKITEAWNVNYVVIPIEEAHKTGALCGFDEKYEDQVKVYFFGDNIKDSFTKEFCGGPHVKNTSELKPIKIYKQDKIGEGKIRIYAKT